jgi:hypothetical protein
VNSLTAKAHAIHYWWTQVKHSSSRDACIEVTANCTTVRSATVKKGEYIAFAEFDRAYVEKQLHDCEAFCRMFVRY